MESKDLFFYELEGRGYIFQNKKWDESKHGFEDDMLNMAWEMWSSTKSQKSAVPEGYKLVSLRDLNDVYYELAHEHHPNYPLVFGLLERMTEAQEQVG